MSVSRSTALRVSAVIAVLAISGLAWVLLPVVRASQPPSGGFRWWQTQKQELGLSDEQAARIDAIFQASIPKFRESKKELDQLEETLSKMIADGTANEAAVAAQVDRVEAARSSLSKARTLMLYRMHQVLTPAQRAKLNVLHDHYAKDRDRGKRPKGGR